MTTLRVNSRQFPATAPAFNQPYMHLAPLLGVTQFEFCGDFWHQKTRVPGLWWLRCNATRLQRNQQSHRSRTVSIERIASLTWCPCPVPFGADVAWDVGWNFQQKKYY